MVLSFRRQKPHLLKPQIENAVFKKEVTAVTHMF